MFGTKKCVYCNQKVTRNENGLLVCKECKRINNDLQPISVLHFEPIAEEHLKLLREKTPGMFEKKIHSEVLKAADEKRLQIAPAISDGYYKWSNLQKEYHEEDQFIRSTEGLPIEGRAYPDGALVSEGKPMYVILLETKPGRKHYYVIKQIQYENLAETLAKIEVDLYQLGNYDPKRRITV